jgi:hypothetical protein
MKVILTFEVELASCIEKDDIMDAVADMEVHLELLGRRLKTELIEVGTVPENPWAA